MLRSPTTTEEDKAILTSYEAGSLEPEQVKTLIERSLDADKAEEIEIIDLRGKSSIADFMIVASGQSSRQIVTFAEKLVERLKAAGLKTIRTEGTDQGNWVVVDTGDIIVHLFRPEVRAFYNIEKMWGSSLFKASAFDRQHISAT
jgi:ribosome-associated protein